MDSIFQPDQSGAVVVHYPLELPILFGSGAGVTRYVSRQEVRFATDVPLAVGQQLAGTLHSPAEGDGIGTRLRYSARVVGVRRPDERGLFEVEAQFEHLGFATLDVA